MRYPTLPLAPILTFAALLTLLLGCPPTRERGGGDDDDVEICDDGEDNDGDGDIDENVDSDGDGHYSCDEDDPDCDDEDSDVYPGAEELCDGVDNDCNGVTDEGCEGDDDDATPDDDDDTGEPDPIIVEVHPMPGTDDFFFQSDLWVEFDRPADDVVMTLEDEVGADVSGTQTQDSPGRVYTFDPDDPLEPDSDYLLTIAWDADGSPVEVAFQTSEYGETVPDPYEMIGRVYSIDIANGTWVEPPGVGLIIGSQLDGMAFLLTNTPESDFGAGEVHVMAVIGEEEGGYPSQDPCVETLQLTSGADGVYGTADDNPGAWDNPRITVGPTDLELAVQGMTTVVQDAYIETTVGPSLDGSQGGVYAGTIDTRPMAEELDPDGGPGAMCDLVWETVGVQCVECGGYNPGEFCLHTRAENLVSEWIPGMELMPITCVDIIDMAEFYGDCESEAMDYDEDGDGTYELCPSW